MVDSELNLKLMLEEVDADQLKLAKKLNYTNNVGKSLNAIFILLQFRHKLTYLIDQIYGPF